MNEKKWNLAIWSTEGMVTIIEIPNWPGRPGLLRRILEMYEQHGLELSERCKTCRHLERYRPDRTEDGFRYGEPTEIPVDDPFGTQATRVESTFPKCRAFSSKNGRTTDWRLNWPACGLWEAKEDGCDED